MTLVIEGLIHKAREFDIKNQPFETTFMACFTSQQLGFYEQSHPCPPGQPIHFWVGAERTGICEP